jgi:hypothetical protein
MWASLRVLGGHVPFGVFFGDEETASMMTFG